MQTPEQNEIEALQIAKAAIEARSEKIIHDTWFYDGSCNSWDPPNAEAEDIIIRHASAVKLIDELLGEYLHS